MSSNGIDVRTNGSIERTDTSNNVSDVEAGKESLKEFSYEEALALIGFGRVQLKASFVCGILLMAVINETMGIGIINIASQCDFNTNSQQKAIMGASCIGGVLVGSFPWGYMADTTGRRIVMLRSTIAAIVFSAISMFISNLWVFVVFRFLSGFGYGGMAATIYAYLGEFNTLKYRPVMINYASMFVGISTAYTPGEWFYFYLNWERVSWCLYYDIPTMGSHSGKIIYTTALGFINFIIYQLSTSKIPILVNCLILAVAWFILPQTWAVSIFGIYDFRPWRLLTLFNFLPGLIGVLWLFSFPETPKLFLSHGKNAEALKVLYWIYETNTGKPSKEFQVKKLKPEENKEFIQMLATKKTAWELTKTIWTETMPLFKLPYVINFSVSCFVMFGLFLASSGMGIWFPEIQNRLGIKTSDENHLTVCEVISYATNETISDGSIYESDCIDEVSTKTYVDTMTLGASYTCAYLILGIVINALGRKAVLAGSLTLGGLCGLSLQWIDEPILIVILFCGFLLLPGLCISVLSGCVVEFIPTHLRGKAICICLMLGRLGSVVGNTIIGGTLEEYCTPTFYSFAGFTILCALLTLTLPI